MWDVGCGMWYVASALDPHVCGDGWELQAGLGPATTRPSRPRTLPYERCGADARLPLVAAPGSMFHYHYHYHYVLSFCAVSVSCPAAAAFSSEHSLTSLRGHDTGPLRSHASLEILASDQSGHFCCAGRLVLPSEDPGGPPAFSMPTVTYSPFCVPEDFPINQDRECCISSDVRGRAVLRRLTHMQPPVVLKRLQCLALCSFLMNYQVKLQILRFSYIRRLHSSYRCFGTLQIVEWQLCHRRATQFRRMKSAALLKSSTHLRLN